MAEAPFERDRFNSVPEISVDVELPRLRRAQRTEDEDVPVASPADDPVPATPGTGNPYDVALKRAQAIKAAAKAERQERLTHERRPLAPLRSERHQSEPLHESRPVERRGRPEAGEGVPADDIGRTGRRKTATHERRPIAPVHSERQKRDQFDETDVDAADAISTDVVEPERQTVPAEPYPDYAEDEYLARRGIRTRQRPEPEQPSRAPEARKNWWRGIFQGRPELKAPQQAVSVNESSTYSDDGLQWRDSADEITEVYTATYHADRDAEEDGVWDDVTGVEEDAWADAGYDPEPDHLVAQANDQYAFDDDAGIKQDAWQDDNIRAAEYEPLNLADERDMSAFRDRLFASAPVEPARRIERVVARPATQHSPISMPRHQSEDPGHHGIHADPMRPDTLLGDPSDAWYEPDKDVDFDLRDLIARDSGLMDMTIEVSPEVPRTCATCRSYRASEQGGRGWCTNTWAFTHRQMVNAEDLPCQSTIGCWWLPADQEVWLEDAEIDYPDTPRVDRLIAHLDPQRRAAGR